MTRLSAALAFSLLALGACSSGSGGNAQASQQAGDETAPFELSAAPVETAEVTAFKSYRFEPAVIKVGAGSEVTWTNEDDFPHNVRFLTGSDETHDLPIGDSVSVTFDEVGDFYYECSLHPQQMRGKVIVGS
ncbi:MAG: plastocyanin/azurin family copper-binding protein [Actinomycetota bacterium]|nr:plastocyanin/azurin family copper-binding protein [Actinomycetota bacterium]